MNSLDLRVYAAHGTFWLMFLVGDYLARARGASVRSAADSSAPGDQPLRAPNAGLFLAVHMAAFALMYMGLGNAVFGRRIPAVSAAQVVAGALIILAGGALAAAARLAFASWRFKAQLDAGHRLATGGPFRWIRHPIYAGLNLLAIGTALWVPNAVTLAGAILMVTGSELRARAEEPLLERAFGNEYREYRGRTRRFIPGLY